MTLQDCWACLIFLSFWSQPLLPSTIYSYFNLFVFKVKYIVFKTWLYFKPYWILVFFRIVETFRESVKSHQHSDQLFYCFSERCIYITWHMLYLQHRCMARSLYFWKSMGKIMLLFWPLIGRIPQITYKPGITVTWTLLSFASGL